MPNALNSVCSNALTCPVSYFNQGGHSGLTPCRRQSKTLLTIDECGSKIARNSVGRQMTIKNSVLFLSIFDICSTRELTFSIAAYPV